MSNNNNRIPRSMEDALASTRRMLHEFSEQSPPANWQGIEARAEQITRTRHIRFPVSRGWYIAAAAALMVALLSIILIPNRTTVRYTIRQAANRNVEQLFENSSFDSYYISAVRQLDGLR